MSLAGRAKKKASAEMREIQPDTQAVSTPVSDLSWTHGQRRVAESSDDEITEEEYQTLGGYNPAMAQIAGLSDIKILYTEEGLGLGNRGRKTNLRKKKVDDACRAACRVIAPSSSKELLKSYITRASR